MPDFAALTLSAGTPLVGVAAAAAHMVRSGGSCTDRAKATGSYSYIEADRQLGGSKRVTYSRGTQ